MNNDLLATTAMRIVGGLASTLTYLIESKECPKCAEVIKRRDRLCKHCNYEYTEADYAEEQDALAKLEDDVRQKEREEEEKLAVATAYELPSAADAHRLINAKQLQELLPVSKMTIWRMETRGELPLHASIGGRNYWRLYQVLDAIDLMASEGRRDGGK
jgi:predicted DNA-binding transcriptional regulator AlpA